MKWFKLATRQYSLQNDQAFRSGWMMDNDYYSLKNYIAIPFDGMADFYLIDNEWNKLMKNLAREFYEDPNFLNKNLKQYKASKNRLIKKSRIFLKDSTKYSQKKLYLFYKDFFNEIHQYCFFAYFPWAINSEIEPSFKKRLRKKFEKEWESIYNMVITPTKYNEITIQLIKLLKMKIAGNLSKGLDDHIKQYQWLPIYDFIGSPWKKKDFLNQLKDIKTPKKELLRFKNELRKNRRKFQVAIKKLKNDRRLLNTSKLIHEYIWLRTDRIDAMRKALFYGQDFYRELEKRLGLKNQESVWMTSDEIKNFLLHDKVNLEEIKKRAKNGCMLYIRNGKQKLIIEPEEMKKIVEKELGIPKKLPKILKGITACKGMAKGRVKIINSAKNISKMKKDNILVASMTLQEYMPAIRKAKAIITDEGGITCHAAIISRELKIPCIIGTKIATKVLKDGDLVEVDANKGIIKILKQ